MAVDFFIIPHNPPHTSEIGIPAAYVFFGGLFSLYFLADFLLLVVPCFLYLRRVRRPVQRWPWIALGVILYVTSAPFWSGVSNHWVASDIIYGSVLAAMSGFASFYFLLDRKIRADFRR